MYSELGGKVGATLLRPVLISIPGCRFDRLTKMGVAKIQRALSFLKSQLSVPGNDRCDPNYSVYTSSAFDPIFSELKSHSYMRPFLRNDPGMNLVKAKLNPLPGGPHNATGIEVERNLPHHVLNRKLTLLFSGVVPGNQTKPDVVRLHCGCFQKYSS
ncbi:MAG: hypothetical protein V4467_01795 [Patescibacteria group bacterium]